MEEKHSELIAIAQIIVPLPERKHIKIVATAKLETKHSEPIVNAPPAELLSERNDIMPVKMEAKHLGPIATALPAEGLHQKSARATSNM